MLSDGIFVYAENYYYQNTLMEQGAVSCFKARSGIIAVIQESKTDRIDTVLSVDR